MDTVLQIGDLQGVLPVAVICWLIGYACRNAANVDNKIIPIIVGVVGGILGVTGHYLGILEFDKMDIYTACATGILSGATALYCNEFVRNLNEKVNGNKD